MAITVKTIPDTNYLLLDSDDGLLLRFTAATAINVTCPDTIVEGFTCEATQAGAGQVTFIKGGTSTFVDIREPTTRKLGAHIAVTLDEPAVYKFNGEFSVATFLSLINQNAIAAPVVTDDSDLGYSNGSLWIFGTKVYDCVDATIGAAVWLVRPTDIRNFGIDPLTDATNISWDLDDVQVSEVTLEGNRILDNPTNMIAGETYVLMVVQDVTGTRTLTYGSAYKWSGGVVPELTVSGDALDIITFISDGTNMFGVHSPDFR